MDNIESGVNVHQVSELWYQQKLCGDALRIKAGKIDAGKEFDVLSSVGDFLSSSAGVSPTLLAFPTYPDPSTGLCAFWTPSEHCYVGAGAFDGSLARGVHTGRLGPAPLWHGNEAELLAECGCTWKCCGPMGPGRIAVGGWYNSALWDHTDGSQDRGTAGFYLLAEELILPRGTEGDNAQKGLSVFARYGHSDADINGLANHIAAGVSLSGTFPSRDSDGAGLMVTTVDLSSDAGFSRDETTVEAYYKFALTPWAAITAHLQQVFNPGGAANVGDACVGALRMQVTF